MQVAERAAAQDLPKQELMNQALATLDRRVFDYNAFDEYNRIMQEDTVLREHDAMTARGEKSEVAAALLAERFGVGTRTIFNDLKAARARAEGGGRPQS